MRKKELVLEVIIETLESINEENEIVQSYKTPIPQIELDLIQENIRKLYANFRLLDKYNQEETEAPGAFQPMEKPIPIAFEKKKEAVQVEAPAEPEPAEVIMTPVNEPEPVAEKEQEVMAETEKAVEQTQKVADYTFDLFSSQPVTLADKYHSDEKTVHEQISSQANKENIASKILQTPITELKSVIGLNDKFIFINELFHGNMKAYQETVHSLDQLTTLNDAIRYFTEVKDTFDMNEELESFRKLAEMIQRKFRGSEK
jgi:hypothetical protein